VGRVEQLLYSYCSPLTSNVKLGTSCSTLPPEAIPPHTVVLRCLKLFYAVHSCSTLPTVALLYPLLLYSACSCSSLPTAALLCPQLFHSAHSRSTLPTAVLLCPQLFYSAHSCSTLLKLFYRTYSPTAPLLYVSVTRQPHRLFHDLPVLLRHFASVPLSDVTYWTMAIPPPCPYCQLPLGISVFQPLTHLLNSTGPPADISYSWKQYECFALRNKISLIC
jgi:hypothetical protein